MAYNRYTKLLRDGYYRRMPSITLDRRSSDYYTVYNRGMSRLDNISYDYYGDAGYDWLILLANPEVADLEFNIPDETVLRIPYPLESVIEEFNKKIDAYDALYGIE